MSTAIGPRSRAALAVVLASAVAALGPASVAAEGERASLPDIEDEVMCPICGTTLELSEAPQAERERELIRRLIAEGRTKEQIKDALVAEYGDEVLAVPERDGFDLTAWIVPVVAIAAAVAALALAATRLRREPAAGPPEEIAPAERERLERDMSAHEPR